MQNLESVKLVSPLAWYSESGKTGFITEIATNRFSLNLADSTKRLAGSEELVVSLPPGGRTYSFRGHAQDDHEPLKQLFYLDDEVTVLDLLGQVRKDQHIEICRHENVESSDRFSGFDQVNFVCNALSELDESDLDFSVDFLGARFQAPLMITGMTGGIDKGMEINIRLARAAEQFGIPMGVGSQRIALENPRYAGIFNVKKHAPGVFLFGNLGFAQLRQKDALDQFLRAVDMVEANAMALHLNVLQECIQVEGDRAFSGILARIAEICRRSPVPVMIKEVGSGIDPLTARKLAEAGVNAIDVGGRGGTSWGYIEGLRSPSSMTHDLGTTFRNWGIPTAYSLAAVRAECPKLPLIATGGVRDGLMVAKACALGANLVGVGLPLLRAALVSEGAVVEVLKTLKRGLEITMMTTGARKISDLRPRLCLGHPLEAEFRSFVLNGSGHS